MIRHALVALTLSLATSVCRAASPLPETPVEQAGFSADGLARIDRFFGAEIARQRLPGAVVAIARDGRLVHHKAYGQLDPQSGTAMPLDAIFQLASMTKVLTSVAGLVLNEAGRLPLKSRLDEYFPAFATMNVGVESAQGVLSLEAARPIFIHDLFRHTSGLTYGARGHTAVHKLYPASSVSAALREPGDEFIARLAALPLLHQPGTVWDYGLSTDVLGLVIEKVSGKRLGEFLREAVFDKVGMPDTHFAPSPAQRARLARPLPKDPLTGQPQRIVSLDATPRFDCGGACAFGTVGDYLRFGQMLLDGGAIDGRRVLSPKTVAWMTSDHLGPRIRNQVGQTEPHRDGYGWGLGVAVRMQDGLAATPGSRGDFTWNGANGTIFWVDPQEKLVVVVGTAAPGEIRKYYREQMGALVYGALTELRRPR